MRRVRPKLLRLGKKAPPQPTPHREAAERQAALTVPPDRPPASSTAPKPAGGMPSLATVITLLAAVPTLGGIAYFLGGLVLTVQAQQAGLPWKTLLSLIDTRQALGAGIRVIFIANVLALALFIAHWVADQLRPLAARFRKPRPKLSKAAAGFMVITLALTLGFFVVFVWAFLLGLLDDGRRYVSGNVRTGVAAALLGVGTAVGAFVFRDARARLVPVGALYIFFLALALLSAPAYYSAALLALVAGAVWASGLPKGEPANVAFGRATGQLILVTATVSASLLFATSSDVRLDTVPFWPASNHRAGLVTTSDGDDTVVVCSRKQPEQLPAVYRVEPSERRHKRVDARPYIVPKRAEATLLSVLRDTAPSARPVEVRETDCGGPK